MLINMRIYFYNLSMKLNKKIVFSFLCFFASLTIHGQTYYLPLNNDFLLRYEPYLNSVESKAHTSFKPYTNKEVLSSANLDSLNEYELDENKFNKTLVGRKLLSEHLFRVKGEDYVLYADPLFDVKIGKDRYDKRSLYQNTRGVWLNGTIGEHFSFDATFTESQAKFPVYLNNYVKTLHIIPGEGRVKDFGGNPDYSNSTGTISYSLKKYFTFQLGQDKNFIGDGYRSMLLSDNSYSYPFLKISADIWKIKYVSLFTMMEDMLIKPPKGYPSDDFSFRKKYASFHYLDFNIGRHVSLGILEAVIFKSDSVRGQGYDISYLNPFIFFRPVEFSLNSPDNVMLGLNVKYKINSKNILYGQLMMDEFKLKEIRSGDGWWGNKQAGQIGFKSFDIAGVPNLDVLTELNIARPYTYQHRSSLSSYSHANQSLAHPLGANFYESVSMVKYEYKRFGIQLKFIYAVFGTDSNDWNYGGNVLRSYEEIYRPPGMEYGNRIAQGLKNKTTHQEILLTYLVNPSYNFRVELGLMNREDKTDFGTYTSRMITFGIRTAITNRYWDF